MPNTKTEPTTFVPDLTSPHGDKKGVTIGDARTKRKSSMSVAYAPHLI